MSDEIQVIEKEALSWPERAAALTITDQQSFNQAASTLQVIAGLQKRIKEHHEPIKTAAHAAHKAAVSAEKRLLDPLDQASQIVRRAISAWTVEQERVRLAQERRLAELARKQEEESRLQAAIEAEEDGHAEAVAEILDAVQPVPMPIAAPTYEKAAGVSTSIRWGARVVNLVELCRAIGAGLVPETAVEPKMSVLNTMAKVHQARLSIPGVVAVPETVVTARQTS